LRVGSETKGKIIDCAIDLFSQKGYYETGVRDIVSHVGIKESSLYNHFKSKQDILSAILDTYKSLASHFSVERFSVEQLLENITHENILRFYPIEFPSGEVEKYRKILCIILHEQFRIPIVRDYMVNSFIGGCKRYIISVTNMLIREGKIEPLDSKMLASMHVAILYYFSNGHLLGIQQEDPVYGGGTMEETLLGLYKNMVKIIPKNGG
jgi:AcrR family transcriptional regulator